MKLEMILINIEKRGILLNRTCSKCGVDMILGCEVYTRNSTALGAGLGIAKKKGKGLFNSANGIVKVALCPECGTIEYYVENPKDFL